MRQKELRIALVCYGGVSLAVYMHGVTKELWRTLQASRAFWSGDDAAPAPGGTAAVYLRLLRSIEDSAGIRLRVLADIFAGASAGGINSVFLAQAIQSGQSLDPLTDMWLEYADVDILLDPEARPWSRATKFWAVPLVSYLLNRPGNAVSASVAPETRDEVREKLSRLIRSRWFEPPFSGIGFSDLLLRALTAMQDTPAGPPLLPDGHPADLFLTATDFKGHLEALRLHSPPVVLESEHRLTIAFHGTAGPGGQPLGEAADLVFAARASASFPGAFPPLQVSEIDRLVQDAGLEWTGRDAFLSRIMPSHSRQGDIDGVSLIDGSVLVNAPFADAMSALRDRPATREVDRRIVYIDPTPDPAGPGARADTRTPGFFSVILGSLSSIPREQPIRDNLEQLQAESRERANLREIVKALRPAIEDTVEKLFGRLFFIDRPTAKRLAGWRARAQDEASAQAGYAYHGYAQAKLSAIVSMQARLIHEAAPQLRLHSTGPIHEQLRAHLASLGIGGAKDLRDAKSPALVDFFKAHDLAFRIRRLRLLARRVTQDWEHEEEVTEQDCDEARAAIYRALALLVERDTRSWLGDGFAPLAGRVFEDPGLVLDYISARRSLVETDARIDAMLAEALERMPQPLRRGVLLAYLGFPFYDTATLPLLRGEGLTEFDPVQVDRISPDDCHGLAPEPGNPLRGTEFYNFGAFFSRAYRENDYLWGRLHGAERMIEIIASSLGEDKALPPARLDVFKREAFAAILDEEESRLNADPGLVSTLRRHLEKAGEGGAATPSGRSTRP